MHVLFVHKNFPAQFGHLAQVFAKRHGWRCEYVSELEEGVFGGIRRHQYKPQGGARQATHFLARTFENAVAHAQGVYVRCRSVARPDLVVGHSGFGSTLFLPELWPDVPIVNYFEYYYRSRNSDLDFRPEYPTPELHFLRARARNAMIQLDLQNCTAGYSPTRWQHSLFPTEYLSKIEVIHDGVDCAFWSRRPGPGRVIAGRAIPDGTRVVTYVARGLESMRGFDVFMETAVKICAERDDVVFVVVGADTVAYGGDAMFTDGRTFREHVLSRGGYDLSRFIFTGRVPAAELVNIFSASDLHIYLTVPFVLSWSLLNAMACGCTVLASDTAPVAEVVEHRRNGLLAPFFDRAALAEQALRVLEEPEQFRERLGAAARVDMEERYSVEKTSEQLRRFLTGVVK